MCLGALEYSNTDDDNTKSSSLTRSNDCRLRSQLFEEVRAVNKLVVSAEVHDYSPETSWTLIPSRVQNSPSPLLTPRGPGESVKSEMSFFGGADSADSDPRQFLSDASLTKLEEGFMKMHFSRDPEIPLDLAVKETVLLAQVCKL